MPRYEELLGTFGQRDDGQPTKPPVPGAPPGVSSPSGPNPPSVNGSPEGRPPNPPFAGSSTPPGTALANKASGNDRDPSTYEDQKQPDLVRQVLMLSKIPSRAEMMDLPPDTDYDTPYGRLGEDGEIAFSPEGEQKYNEQLVHARKKFGATPFADDPEAPQIDAKLGQNFMNPFTGGSGRF